MHFAADGVMERNDTLVITAHRQKQHESERWGSRFSVSSKLQWFAFAWAAAGCSSLLFKGEEELRRSWEGTGIIITAHLMVAGVF